MNCKSTSYNDIFRFEFYCSLVHFKLKLEYHFTVNSLHWLLMINSSLIFLAWSRNLKFNFIPIFALGFETELEFEKRPFSTWTILNQDWKSNHLTHDNNLEQKMILGCLLDIKLMFSGFPAKITILWIETDFVGYFIGLGVIR